MMTRKRIILTISAIALLSVAVLLGQGHQCGPNCPMKQGKGMGPGQHGMHMDDPDHMRDMEAMHFLLDNGVQVRRTVERIATGVRTLTESDDPEIAAVIKKHVTAMYSRIEEDRPIHQRDPLFQALFEHAAEIEMEWVETEKGVSVTETSANPEVVALIQAHADVVSRFIENGRSEAMKDHQVPVP